MLLIFYYLIFFTLLFYFLEPLYAQMLWCWGYYLFIFSSVMECRTLSQRCCRLYFPIFLFRVGLFTLMYMASLMALAILCPSLPMIWKFSTDDVCQCCSGTQKWVMVHSHIIISFKLINPLILFDKWYNWLL